MAQLDGKVVIVTGGTQGVGEAVARHAVDGGASGIVVCGRQQEKCDSTEGDHEASVWDIAPLNPFVWEHGENSVTNCPAIGSPSAEQEGSEGNSGENPDVTGANRHLVAVDD